MSSEGAGITKEVKGADVFATTHWTVVIAAGQGSSRQADVALEELCRTYWYPLYVTCAGKKLPARMQRI